MNKTLKHLTLAAIVLAAAASPRLAMAQTNYPDATGENIWGAGIGDITSVEVSNDAFDLIFKINVNGNPITDNYGKYLIGFSTGGAGGASPDFAGNGWGRPITMASGMDYWVGSWVDGPMGVQLWKYTTGWNQINQPTISTTTTNVVIRVPYGAMGLTSGNSFDFDVYTSGGGNTDGAIDALSTPSQTIAQWGDPFVTAAASNRTYTIIAPPAPTNNVFFQVDMGVPAAEASLTGGFNPGAGDKVYVRGNFNAWPALPAAEYELKLQTGTVYTNTVKIVGNAGTGISYKYFIDFNSQEENRVLSCNNPVRSATLNGTNLTTPLANWGDQLLTDPTNDITLQVDMTVPTATGQFVPGTDSVYVRGNFNNWGNSPGSPLLLTNLPPPNTNIYAGVLSLPHFPVNGCRHLTYKFLINGNYETINDRQVDASGGSPTLLSYYNDVDICDVLVQTNFVTFTVNMTNAVGSGGSPTYFSGTNVYINGDFVGWKSQTDNADWGSNPKPELMLTNVPGTALHAITMPFPPGQKLSLNYKYSMGGPDNEAGPAQNHVRYIRTVPGQTEYSIPLDTWTGTNANNIANLQEPKFGNLRAVPGSPGQVQVQWLGIKCVQLQSAGSLTSPGWVTYSNTSGFSGTNFPTSGGQQYFRLVDPSP